MTDIIVVYSDKSQLDRIGDVGGGAQGADGHAVVARGGDAGGAQPGGGAAAGVNLDGERDEGEEGGQGKETDADEEQAGEGLDHEDAGEEDPRQNV